DMGASRERIALRPVAFTTTNPDVASSLASTSTRYWLFPSFDTRTSWIVGGAMSFTRRIDAFPRWPKTSTASTVRAWTPAVQLDVGTWKGGGRSVGSPRSTAYVAD